ncbi:MAG: family 43 glycosylhydrolase [Bacteroidota bacterium]|nr:family 43 glycosylhydrolase [Bacteroidota bacterium]
MKKLFLCIAILVYSSIAFCQIEVGKEMNALQNTICNPLNLSYRFCLDNPSRREAADPTMIMFEGEYFLFASKSGGYWHSKDLIHWDFITSTDLPFEEYAPAAVVIKDKIYFIASGNAPRKIYKTSDPQSGKWEVANATFPIGMTDPDLFLDEDGRLYFYYGCSNVKPIYGVELDPETLNPIGKPVECFNSNKATFGWERPGDYNNENANPWTEGSWMTKHNGKYYLQYATPGTQFKSYCDGVYVSDKPLGPFKPALHNPCSYKPEGFIAGAGHSSTFQDKYGNYWHISTMTISVKHMFERRLGLFPMFFDKDGELYTYTGFGDFPFIIPQKKISGPEALFPGWMLLSFHKPVQVSSEIKDHAKNLANDEEVRTYWSAKTGGKGEWINMDLQKRSMINAIQINFAENDTRLLGRSDSAYYQYLLEYSNDNITWKPLVDKRLNKTDVPHDYIQLTKPIQARYVKVTNYHVPDGTFAVSDLRIFGKGTGGLPGEVENFRVQRNQNDNREVELNWKKNPDAVGYNIRYGEAKDKLYHNYQVLDKSSVVIRSLNSNIRYCFTIDAFNEGGIHKGTKIVVAQ